MGRDFLLWEFRDLRYAIAMLERECWFANTHRLADVLGQKHGTLPLGALFSERKCSMKTTEDPRPWCGMVPVVYEGLSMFSKPFSRYNFSLEHCSLVEYIGVEWAMRVPLSEHRAYMTTIFERLAMAGNDEAAQSAFLLIATEIIPMTEFQLRAPAYIGRASLEEQRKLREELLSEVLEFIRTHFWTMPIKPGDMRGWDKVLHTKPDRKEEFLLLKTRQEMARQCMRHWSGIAGKKNDELAFCMLAERLLPHMEGVCV